MASPRPDSGGWEANQGYHVPLDSLLDVPKTTTDPEGAIHPESRGSSTAVSRTEKAKHHRRRHVPVGPAGVWFQAQQQHTMQGGNSGSSSSTTPRSSTADLLREEEEEEAGIEFFTQTNTTTTPKTVAPTGGVACYSPAWISMQCDLQFVTPSLLPYMTESDRYTACRPHIPSRYVMIPEILAGQADWKLPPNRRLVVLVHAIQCWDNFLWVAEVTDETGAKLLAWMSPRLVQKEQQQRQVPKFIRPGVVWMLRDTTVLLDEGDDDDDGGGGGDDDENTRQEEKRKNSRILLVGEQNIERVWTPASGEEGLTDAAYIQWMEKRSALATTVNSVDDTQENDLLTDYGTALGKPTPEDGCLRDENPFDQSSLYHGDGSERQPTLRPQQKHSIPPSSRRRFANTHGLGNRTPDPLQDTENSLTDQVQQHRNTQRRISLASNSAQLTTAKKASATKTAKTGAQVLGAPPPPSTEFAATAEHSSSVLSPSTQPATLSQAMRGPAGKLTSRRTGSATVAPLERRTTQTPTAGRMAGSAIGANGFQRFPASPVSELPKTRMTPHPRTAAETSDAPFSSTPFKSSNSPLAATTPNENTCASTTPAAKKLKLLSSSSSQRKKRQSRASPKRKSNVWITTHHGSMTLDEFDEDDPVVVVATSKDTAAANKKDTGSANGVATTHDVEESSPDRSVKVSSKGQTSMFQSSAFAGMEMEDLFDDDDD